MFSDGLLYACISRNLAQGIGGFWIPSYSSTDYPVFLEHPPLAFGLQAAAFFFFGDHLFVERGYALVMGAGTGLLVMMIWRSTVGGKSYDWLPLVFWLLPSTVSWVIVNNMLENTQALFTTMAKLAVVRFAEPGERVVEVAVDPELGGEGFTFRLASGREGSVHMDQVLDCDVDLVVRAKIA